MHIVEGLLVIKDPNWPRETTVLNFRMDCKLFQVLGAEKLKAVFQRSNTEINKHCSAKAVPWTLLWLGLILKIKTSTCSFLRRPCKYTLDAVLRINLDKVDLYSIRNLLGLQAGLNCYINKPLVSCSCNSKRAENDAGHYLIQLFTHWNCASLYELWAVKFVHFSFKLSSILQSTV